MLRFIPLGLTVWILSGCAGFPAGRSASRHESPRLSETPAQPVLQTASAFGPPTALDQLLDARPHALPAVRPAALPAIAPFPGSTRPGKETPAAEASGESYRIQVDALSDVDAAQARKAKLEGMLGTRIDMVFDPPYYKLRFGNFTSKREAEDKLVELAGKNLQGFIVRQ